MNNPRCNISYLTRRVVFPPDIVRTNKTAPFMADIKENVRVSVYYVKVKAARAHYVNRAIV